MLLKSNKKKNLKTFIVGGVPPFGGEVSFHKSQLDIIKSQGNCSFFEFPLNLDKVNICYFKTNLKTFLNSLSNNEKGVIIGLSAAASYILQSSEIIKHFKQQIEGILFIHPIVSLQDTPKKLLNKQSVLKNLNKQNLSRICNLFNLRQEQKNKILSTPIEIIKEIIKHKILLMDISESDIKKIDMNVPFLIQSIITLDDCPDGSSVSPLYKNILKPGGLSSNYKLVFDNRHGHGELHKYPKDFATIIASFFTQLKNTNLNKS